MTVGLAHYLFVAACLFTIGIFGIFLNRKNVIVILMSVELMLLAVNINLVAFSAYLGDLVGQIFALFVLTVAAGEAAIGGDHHQHGGLHLALLEQWMIQLGGGSGELAQHVGDLLGIGARGLRALLRAAQLRRGHHLHGLEDLLHALGGADAPPQVLQ